MPNLLDLMTDDDKALVKTWAEQRQNPKHKQDIPTPLYICAQLGYYYGWDAVNDYRRGYSIGYEPVLDENDQPTNELRMVRYAFTLQEAVGLIEAARKVHYRLKLDEGKVFAANNASCQDIKNANRTIKEVSEFAKRL